MTDADFNRLAAHQPELAARLADFHVSFTIGGRVFSRTIKHTTLTAAHAFMDRWVEEMEDEITVEQSQRLAPACARNCTVRKIERIDPEVRAHMAQARAHGASR